MSRFEQIMSSLGYELFEKEGKKLRYKKRTRFSSLLLIFDIEHKYINPVLIPESVIVYKSEIEGLSRDYDKLIEDAKTLAEMGNYRVLNQ